MKNLIYISVFCQKSYIKLLELLLVSLSSFGNFDPSTTDILILTTPSFTEDIKKAAGKFSIKFFYLDINGIFEAACSRLQIFKYEQLSNYDKLLYIDTDIIVTNSINNILDLQIDDDKIYCTEEGTIYQEYYGGKFYANRTLDENTSAFSSGIIFFKNSPIIKSLFSDILNHIHEDTVVNQNPPACCLDQSYIVYNCVIQNKYDNKLLVPYFGGNPGVTYVKPPKLVYRVPASTPDNPIYRPVPTENVFCPKIKPKEGAVLYHFLGSLGNGNAKFERMVAFLNAFGPE
jgi:hypothetical protein